MSLSFFIRTSARWRRAVWGSFTISNTVRTWRGAIIHREHDSSMSTSFRFYKYNFQVKFCRLKITIVTMATSQAHDSADEFCARERNKFFNVDIQTWLTWNLSFKFSIIFLFEHCNEGNNKFTREYLTFLVFFPPSCSQHLNRCRLMSSCWPVSVHVCRWDGGCRHLIQDPADITGDVDRTLLVHLNERIFLQSRVSLRQKQCHRKTHHPDKLS